MKVLIVSANAFSKIYNNGKTLEAIFRCFQPSELAQLFTRPQDSVFTDYNFCDNYYVVSEMDIINKLRGKTNTCGSVLIHDEKSYQSKVYNKFKNSRIKYFSLLRDTLWSLNIWKTKELDNWIKAQNVDMVFLVGGGTKYLHSLGHYISSILSVPLCVFYTDDYLIHPKFKGLIGTLQKVLMRKHYKRIIKYASGCFAIGDMMSKEYGEYFGKEFYPIMNSIPSEQYREYEDSQPHILSYFGGLHLNRWQMICRIGVCLPNGWELHVYSASELSKEIAKSFLDFNIKYLGCVTGNDLKDRMRNSAALLHVESDDLDNRALTHLSVSTKIPEYLMSGRLIIGFGPQEVASMRLLTDNDIGIGIDSCISTEQIKEKLRLILSDAKKRVTMGKKAYNYARVKFDGVINATNFRKHLENIVKKE